jgi:uncharacterized membrane protein
MIAPAVSLTSVALAIHIAAVVVGFGPLFVYPALVAAVRRSEPAALAAVHRAQQLVAKRVVTPALPLLLVAGLYLAGEQDAFGKAWVIVAMVMIVILMAMHRVLLIRGYRRLAEEAAASDGRATGRYQELARQTDRAELAAAGLVLFTIYVMSAKPLA